MNESNKRIRRIRSLSASYESYEFAKISLDNEEENSIFTKPSIFNQKLACSLDRTHSQKSFSIFESIKKVPMPNPFIASRASSTSFQNLPDEIIIHIFSYLNALELGRIVSVCRRWNSLLSCSLLWGNVDLNLLATCPDFNNSIKDNKAHECNQACYSRFLMRTKTYLLFLTKIRPPLFVLKFSLDIGDMETEWNTLLQDFLKSCRCRDLKYIDINWAETSFKQHCNLFSALQTHATWSHSNFKELSFKKKLRQRRFVYFFDLLTALATNCIVLKLPFDWSERSVQAFSRLQQLRHLKLCRYFSYSPIETTVIERLLHSLPNLKSLYLEIHVESYNGMLFFKMQSNSLEILDISKSKGIYLSDLKLPNLKLLRIDRNLLRFPSTLIGNFLDREDSNIKCLYDILTQDITNLKQINEHVLEPSWCQPPIYPKLNTLLQNICCCRAHYNSE